MQTDDGASLLESSMPLVESVVTEVARRQRVSGDQLPEFRSLAYLKLVEHDYAVLRQFQGASSLRTYLTVVLRRVLFDYRNREWGRWRPSAAANRIGPAAVRLERLVTRDGLTPGAALATLDGTGTDVTECAGFVETLQGRVPLKPSRATLGEEAIPECLDPAPGPEACAARREHARCAGVLRRVVQRALRSLDSQDHLIVTLRFRDGLTVAQVARLLDLEAKPLYRRVDRILAQLQALVSADARHAQLARELAGDTWCDFAPCSESGWWRPSKPIGGPSIGGRGDVVRGAVPRRGAARCVHRRVSRDAVRLCRAASL